MKYKLSVVIGSTEPLSNSELKKLSDLIVATVENCRNNSGSWYECEVESTSPVEQGRLA